MSEAVPSIMAQNLPWGSQIAVKKKKIINKNLSNFSEQTLVKLLLYGNPSLTFEENKEIIKASIIFIHSSQRFAGALM